jgi:hypothetical protein
MSVRFANNVKSRDWAGMLLALVVFVGLAAGSPPLESSLADKVDDKPPIPQDIKQAQDAARFRLNKELVIFTGFRDPKTGVVQGGIEDDRPLASEKQSPDEYRSLTEVMLHASQFSATDLAQNGRRDLTPDDLTFGTRLQYRLELIRFEGKLTRARRLPPTKSLEEMGFKELFEAWLVPEEESPGYPLCLLLSSWPAELGKLPEIVSGQPAGESVTIDKWIAFGGYSFKLMTFPGPGADPKTPTGAGWLKAALLVSKSIVPAVEPAPKLELDKNLRVFKEIRDKTRLTNLDLWEERTAWNRVVMHARRFSTEQLEAAANSKLTFADLFKDNAREDHRLELVSFQGRLVRLNPMKSPERLAQAGVETVYEAWVIPNGELKGNPICFVLSELPAGLEPKRTMDVPVTAAGYSFKLLRYESGEPDKEDPARFIDKLTPMLIGRSLTVKHETVDAVAWWTEGFVPAVVGGVAVLGGAALLLGFWFRKGDKVAQTEIDANRHRNPFEN